MTRTSGIPSPDTGSLSQQARDWIFDLRPLTTFRPAAVPGEGTLVRNVIARLMAEERPIIGRIGRGVYWRRYDWGDPWYDLRPRRPELVLGPPGTGYANGYALNVLGWSTQKPCIVDLAVPHRNLRTPQMYTPGRYRFCYRSNPRRRELNSREATVLEAATQYWLSDCHGGWQQAMRGVRRWWAAGGTPIRKDMLMWAAETERIDPVDARIAGEGDRSFTSVMARLDRDLPDMLCDP